ncbi:hypothetical protein ACQ4WX_50810 [Streptomyces lasalocidi]
MFESDNLGVTEEFLCHAYARMRIGSTTPTASARHAYAATPRRRSASTSST